MTGPYGTASLDAQIVTLAVTDAAVDARLPSWLERVPVERFPEGTHPLTMLVGAHSDLRSVVAGLSLPLFESYQEALVTIPSVRVRGTNDPRSTYMATLRLNHRGAIALGRAYGLPKRRAEFARSDGVTRVSHAGEILLDLELREAAETARAIPEMSDPLVVRWLGSVRYIGFDWDLAHAEIRPLEGFVRIASPLIGLEIAGSYDIRPLEERGIGAFSIRTRWRMQATPTRDHARARSFSIP